MSLNERLLKLCWWVTKSIDLTGLPVTCYNTDCQAKYIDNTNWFWACCWVKYALQKYIYTFFSTPASLLLLQLSIFIVIPVEIFQNNMRKLLWYNCEKAEISKAKAFQLLLKEAFEELRQNSKEELGRSFLSISYC